MADMPLIRRHVGGFHWEAVEVLAYKQDPGVPFKDVTRQVLFDSAEPPVQLRYFEVAPGGFTTPERHQHTHSVMVVRGKGECLLGDESHAIAAHDLVSVPPMTWHQFRASGDEPLGFLCLVARERDKPEVRK